MRRRGCQARREKTSGRFVSPVCLKGHSPGVRCCIATHPTRRRTSMSEKTLSAQKVGKLLNRLHAPDEAIRVHAALRLTGAGVDESQVRPILEAALGDPDPH